MYREVTFRCLDFKSFQIEGGHLPDRRTITVLGTLSLAMAIATGLLVVLEPADGSLSLSTVERQGEVEDTWFNTQVNLDDQRWSAIVVRFSGSDQGSASLLRDLHQKAGLKELAYHFTVGNGNGAKDGQVEVGNLWQAQRPGFTALVHRGQGNSNNVVDICLIGDYSKAGPTDRQRAELVNLVQKLQNKLSIPAHHVQIADGKPDPRHRFFPIAWFRQQLVSAG